MSKRIKNLKSPYVLLILIITLPLLIWFVLTQSFEIREKAAICNEQCPVSNDPSYLYNCHPPESDGSASISVCSWAGRVEFCGTTNFCCPSAGSAWTTNMSLCPSPTLTPIPTPTQCPTKIGDVNNDCHVNTVDIAIVVDNYDTSPPTDPRADVNNDNRVNIVDIGLIVDNYEI